MANRDSSSWDDIRWALTNLYPGELATVVIMYTHKKYFKIHTSVRWMFCTLFYWKESTILLLFLVLVLSRIPRWVVSNIHEIMRLTNSRFCVIWVRMNHFDEKNGFCNITNFRLFSLRNEAPEFKVPVFAGDLEFLNWSKWIL